MSREEIFRNKQKDMSDSELSELARKEISKLCETGGRSLIMSVPPMITDTDMLLCEVLRRFNILSGIDKDK